ncbi:MAG: 6-phosphofructokinase 1 [Petroclostridium sp.]|jgi:6-phosphofructokinase 1|uniref:ATP-dependent 6-phosphofructokinase n=1 Tax=Petroclostridium xylanilyticum TaxID=1792311 RepID=UPI000B9801C2|nr:ATP-dependent 6-phosphofructokinase [Petroclostridium xylanilyticum]MDK2809828.1 6-phosphofructokinase 1 [Petroclostridium sp.]
MKRIGVLTSGGDSPGMNACIRAIVKAAKVNNIETIGIYEGYKGLMEGKMQVLTANYVDDIIELSGTILKSARSKLFKTEEGLRMAKEQAEKNGIEGLIVIGGDGSFRGACDVSKYGLPVIGIPGTIDNDIAGTEYSIGADTAVNIVTDTISKIHDTARSLIVDTPRVFLVEVMGRGCGYIAITSAIAGGADYCLVPEVPYDINKMCSHLQTKFENGKVYSVVIVAEGATSVNELKKQVDSILNIDSRTCVLGHLQRGGAPTAFDRLIASQMAVRAVELLIEGKTNRMVGVVAGKAVDCDIFKGINDKNKITEEIVKLNNILIS